ncbi:MAG: FixH family protein [Phycisphaeraceae bacterium]|nr:FixH family protein [Phycisphaeraceae bacterium]
MTEANKRATASGTIPTMGRGRRWIGLIIGLIGMNMGIVATTVYLATSDRSAGVEPDYYARALNYDRVILQRTANRRLGWKSTATLTGTPDGKLAVLHVQLKDGEGNPVPAALVRAVAFSSLRSGERSSVQLREFAGGYEATVPVSASGQWRVQLTAKRGADTFTSEQDVALTMPTASNAARGTGDLR